MYDQQLPQLLNRLPGRLICVCGDLNATETTTWSAPYQAATAAMHALAARFRLGDSYRRLHPLPEPEGRPPPHTSFPHPRKNAHKPGGGPPPGRVDYILVSDACELLTSDVHNDDTSFTHMVDGKRLCIFGDHVPVSARLRMPPE